MFRKIFKESDLKHFESLLARADNIVLTCHVRPDGDALGSTLGLMHILKGLGKKAVVVTPDQAPKTLSFLPSFKEIIPYTKYPDYAERLVRDASLLICCDFNKPSRLEQMSPVLENAGCSKVLIDHHQNPDDFADITFSFPEMSSTCELVFRLVAALGLYSDMDLDSATCICTGLITDTRNFSVNCSNPEIYSVLMKLLEKGVDKPFIVRQALELRTLDSMKLQSYALYEKMEIFDRHHASVITLDRDELDRFHYERGDTEGLVNMPLQVAGITYSFFLREDPDCVKVSARSVDNFPVSRICEDLYGGGGHIMAAGGEFKGTLEECRRILIEAMPKYDCYLKSKKGEEELRQNEK